MTDKRKSEKQLLAEDGTGDQQKHREVEESLLDAGVDMGLDRAEAGRLMKSTQYAMKQLSLQMIMASALARAQEWTEATAEQKEVIKARERAAQSTKMWADIQQQHHHHVPSDAEAEADDEDKEEAEEEQEEQ
jgi:hypothetical protein